MAARNATGLSDGGPAVPQDAGIGVFPVDRERFVDLDVLAGFYAPAAENALVGIVAIERICVIDLVRFRSEWDLLMLNRQQLCRVMNSAISIVVVADCAIKKVITEDAIEGFYLRGRGLCCFCGDCHSVGDFGCARPNQSAIFFDHACVTRLNRAELWVIADVGNRGSCAVDQIDEKFVRLCFPNNAVKIDFHHDVFLLASFRCKLSSRRPKSKNHNGRKVRVSRNGNVSLESA
jgi:hypothetical protein